MDSQIWDFNMCVSVLDNNISRKNIKCQSSDGAHFTVHVHVSVYVCVYVCESTYTCILGLDLMSLIKEEPALDPGLSEILGKGNIWWRLLQYRSGCSSAAASN